MELNGLPPLNLKFGLGGGTDASGTASSAVSTHNSDSSAHSSLFEGKQDAIAATGLLKGSGSGIISAAVEGTDYIGADSGKALPERISADMVEVSANTTLGLTHAGKNVIVNSTSARTITIPTNASVEFPIGTEIEVTRYGTGDVTIAGASGVTVQGKLKLGDKPSAVGLKKKSNNEWWVIGGSD